MIDKKETDDVRAAASRERREETDWVDPLSESGQGDYGQTEYDDPLERLLAEEKVSEITVRPWATVSPETTVRRALDLFDDRVSCALVTRRAHLVGIFSEWDLLQKVTGLFDDLDAVTVGEVMTERPVFVFDFEPIASVLSVVALCGYRHVPVLDADDHVLGLVTPGTLASFLRQRLDAGASSGSSS